MKKTNVILRYIISVTIITLILLAIAFTIVNLKSYAIKDVLFCEGMILLCIMILAISGFSSMGVFSKILHSKKSKVTSVENISVSKAESTEARVFLLIAAIIIVVISLLI